MYVFCIMPQVMAGDTTEDGLNSIHSAQTGKIVSDRINDLVLHV